MNHLAFRRTGSRFFINRLAVAAADGPLGGAGREGAEYTDGRGGPGGAAGEGVVAGKLLDVAGAAGALPCALAEARYLRRIRLRRPYERTCAAPPRPSASIALTREPRGHPPLDRGHG